MTGPKMQAKSRADIIRQMALHNASPLIQNDTAALVRYLAKDFLLNTSGTNVSFGRERIVSAIRRGRIRSVQFDVRTDTVCFSRKRLAISMGTETVVSNAEGNLKGQIQNRRFTNFWTGNGRSWKLKARHSRVICTGDR